MREAMLANERGSQTIEFLMIVPAVLLLLLCLGEFATVAFYKFALQSAARDGAHLAALQARPEEVEAAAKRAAGGVPVYAVEMNQDSADEVSVKVISLYELKTMKRLRLPDGLSQLRLEAESRVPVVGNHD